MVDGFDGDRGILSNVESVTSSFAVPVYGSNPTLTTAALERKVTIPDNCAIVLHRWRPVPDNTVYRSHLTSGPPTRRWGLRYFRPLDHKSKAFPAALIMLQGL